MAEHPNVEKFRRALRLRGGDELSGDDAAQVESLFADDVNWHGGSQGAKAAVASWSAPGRDGQRLDVGEVYADDFHVVGVVDRARSGNGDGTPIRQVNVFHLAEDGTVEDLWTIPSDAAVQEALESGTEVPSHPNRARFVEAETARSRAEFTPEDLELLHRFFLDEVTWHSGGRTEWAKDPVGFDGVIKRYKGFRAATGGTLKLTIREAFADDDHAISFVRLTAERPGHPDKHMDVRECLVFHLDDEGRAYEFWGIPHDAEERDAFWIDDRPQEVIREAVKTALGLPALLTNKGTGGAMTMLEVELPPYALLAPVHVHHAQDEASYVLEGELSFYLGGEVTQHAAGAFAFKPKGVPHTIFNHTDKTARFLELCWPGGLDEYLEDMAEVLSTPGPPDLQKVGAVAAKHGIESDFSTIAELAEKYGVHQLGM
jgi:quercetin dioxygenase-like cupin family protein